MKEFSKHVLFQEAGLSLTGRINQNKKKWSFFFLKLPCSFSFQIRMSFITNYLWEWIQKNIVKCHSWPYSYPYLLYLVPWEKGMAWSLTLKRLCNTGESGLSLGAASHANHYQQNCLEIEYKTKEPFSSQLLDSKFLLQSLLPVVQNMLSGLVRSNMKQYKTCWESWFVQIWNNTKHAEKAGSLKYETTQNMLRKLIRSNTKQYKICWESWFVQIWNNKKTCWESCFIQILNNTKHVETAGLLK